MNNTYIRNNVSKKAILNFLKKENDLYNTEIHAFSVIHHGELLCRIAVPPYSINDNKQLFSLSKSFCSTAVGFAVDEGLFKVSDRIVDIFPDKCPSNISEKLSKMTVHNVLTMSTGHKSCVMSLMKDSTDPVREFLKAELTYFPGEKFVYNTGATYLLSIIVQKYTGKTVYEYLYDKYFSFLDHIPEKWDMTCAGYCEGGCGLYAEIQDIENLGKLYLGKGVLNGRRFLSEEWVNTASSKQIDNSGNGTEDWSSGYGYQFWMNSRDGFRGDGACGQVCFVMPKNDMIICVQCECKQDMQLEVNGVYELAEQIYNTDDTSIDIQSELDIMYETKICQISDFIGFNKCFKLKRNPNNISFIDFKKIDNSIEINIVCSGNSYKISANPEEYTLNSIYLKSFKPTLYGLIPARLEECRFSCRLIECSESKLEILLRYSNAPQTEHIVFEIIEDEITIQHICRTADVIPEAKFIKGTKMQIINK